MHLSHSRAVFMMVLVTLMWSIAGVTTRYLQSAQSFEITFWRSFFTVLSLLVILPLLKGRTVFAKILSGGTTLWLSGVCWAVMFTAFMVALSMSPVANVLVTMSIGPLLTALLARFAIGHQLPLRTWVAIAVAGIGIATMYGTQLSSAGSPAQLLGTLVALCVPIAGAINWTVVQRSHAHGQDVDLVPSVLVGAVLSTLVTLPLALPFQATPHDLGLLAMLGSVQLAIPCILSVWCARVLKAPEVSLLQLLEVLFGITLAWLGANEVPGMAVLLGGTLVLGALVANEALGWWQRRAIL
jgi:drug/metabolite transporter (DMT)-like permease